MGHSLQIKSWIDSTTVCDTSRFANRGMPGHGLDTRSQTESECSIQKLKFELLPGSRPKIESFPFSVVVHEHLVRAGCMFFGTTTRRTLTRYTGSQQSRPTDCRASWTLPRSARTMSDSGQLRSSTSLPRYHADFFTFAEHVSYEHATGSSRPMITSRRERNINKQTNLNSFFALDWQSVRFGLPVAVWALRPVRNSASWHRDFLSNIKYQYRPHTQPDVAARRHEEPGWAGFEATI